MDNNSKPKIICLTPVKNESWILDRFLKAASLWADYIIISDQGSTDGSIEIAKKYSKVILLENKELPFFDEYLMRKPLFDEARKIEGPRILISLDADELLTPDWSFSMEWETLFSAAKGTILAFPLFNVKAGFDYYWCPGYTKCGYVDDNAEYIITGQIHVSRSIIPPDHDVIYFKEMGIIHFQYTDWKRMLCKHRWYQCFELIQKINNPVSIFRRYHHMYAIDGHNLMCVPEKWIAEYTKCGIDITSVCHQVMLQWEKVVLDYMDQFGVRFFAHLNIWDVNWTEIAQKWNFPHPEKYKDPRKKWERAINKWLKKTQSKKNLFWVRQVAKLVNLFY